MKRYLIMGALLACCCAITAKADLGDTYAQSCRRYGGQGRIAFKTDMLWLIAEGHLYVQEQFHHNQCVAIQYTPAPGRYLYESGIWDLLRTNSRAGDNWHTNYTDAAGDPEYVNNDGTLYGKFFPAKGSLRICYASWLKRHGLLNGEEAEGRAPVEDEVVPGTSM